MDLLIGLHKPKKGSILIDNKNITLFDQSWKNLIGYVPQNIYLLDGLELERSHQYESD